MLKYAYGQPKFKYNMLTINNNINNHFIAHNLDKNTNCQIVITGDWALGSLLIRSLGNCRTDNKQHIYDVRS